MSDGHKMTDEHVTFRRRGGRHGRRHNLVRELHRGFVNYHLTTTLTTFVTAKMTKSDYSGC